MKRALYLFMLVVGWVCSAALILLGGSFGMIFLSGFVGTSGREAGGPLLASVAVVLLGIAVGYICMKVGIKLKRSHEN